MSDKPILAEIVRADQIRVGDRITWRRAIVEVKAIVDQDGYLDIVYDQAETDCAIPVWKDELIARILPDPVEVREFWRAIYHEYDGDRYGEICNTREAAMSDAENSRCEQTSIEHVRETILSREEVQP